MKIAIVTASAGSLIITSYSSLKVCDFLEIDLKSPIFTLDTVPNYLININLFFAESPTVRISHILIGQFSRIYFMFDPRYYHVTYSIDTRLCL